MSDSRPIDWFECEEGYPTEASIKRLEKYEFGPKEAALFLVEELPKITKGISCMTLRQHQKPDMWHRDKVINEIEFHTGGWSGAEELINAMLGHFWISHFQARWERGGHFYFEVPNAFFEGFAEK